GGSLTHTISCIDTTDAANSSTGTFTINALADTTPPSVPTGLSAVLDAANPTSQINLSWNASTDDDGGVGLGGYTIYRVGSSTPLATVTGTSFTDMGLTPGTLYTYAVGAYDASGNGSANSAPASASTIIPAPDTIAPSVPDGLTAARDATNPD